MAMKIGRDLSITINGTEVLEVTGISFTPAGGAPVEVKTLGSTHTKIIGHGILTAAGTVSMIQDLDDAGQRVMREAAESSTFTLISGVKINYDTDCYESDTVTDSAAGCDFTNYQTSGDDAEAPITATIDFSFSGATKLTEA